jgi:hypothetical protein
MTPSNASEAYPLCVEQVVAAWCHDDLGLLLNSEVGPGEVRVNVVFVQLQDLQTKKTTAQPQHKQTAQPALTT